MRKVIIFGATGCVGAYTAVELASKFEVVAVGRRKSDNGFFGKLGIKYYSVDVTKSEEFDNINEKDIYAVIHLAGVMPATMEGYHPHVYIDSIIHGTLNVLQFCVKNNVDRVVFGQSRADSNYLMGKTPIPSDIIKKFPLKGDHSIYSICKNAAVDLIEHFYYQYGLKRFVLRLPTIYAYHPDMYFYVDGVKKPIAYRYLINRAINGETIEIWGDPQKAKEIVYVKDAIQIIERSLLSSLDGGVYNVGAGKAVTLEEQIKGIIDVFSPEDNKSPIVYCPNKPNAREYINDITKTINELGYNPMYDYRALLLDYKKYMDEEPFSRLWGNRKQEAI